jgi:hypothetical protein
MKKLIFLGACLVALASQPAQAGGTQLAIVRITEYPSTAYVSVTQAEGKSEQWKFDIGSTGKRLDDAGQGYYKLLAGLYQQGYHLQSTFTAAVDATISRTTMVLVKGQ